MSEKVCSKCGVVYEDSDEHFYRQHGKLMTICKECIKNRSIKNYYAKHEKYAEQHRQYYQENHDKVRSQQNQMRLDNPELIRQRDRDYWERNKDKKSAKDKIYREKHKEQLKAIRKEKRKTEGYKIKHSIRNKRYRQTENGRTKKLLERQRRIAKEAEVYSNFTSTDWDNCLNHFDHKCAYCGKSEKLTQDHFIPLSHGGEYALSNIIPVCLSCNSSKRDQDFFTWYSHQPSYSKQRELKILDYLNYDPKTHIQQLTLIV